MIKTTQLIYEFDLRYNRLQSTFDQSIRLEDKLAIINQALRLVYRHYIKYAEVSSDFRDTLKPLEVKEYELEKVKETANYSVFQPHKDQYKQLRIRVVAEKEGCGKKTIPVIIFQTDDLDNSLLSSFWKPDYAWEIVIGDEGSEGYYLWHNNDFRIVSAICDFYRKHSELHCPSLSEKGYYIDWNGVKQTKDVDLELDRTFVFDNIIDVAILIARSIKGDERDFELQLNKILSTEKINS